MKGFPNQVSDLKKLTAALRIAGALAADGHNVLDDQVYGTALVRGGVSGTGHTPMAVEEYLREQLKKPASYRSFQTTARGLRELFRVLDLMDEDGSLTPQGVAIAQHGSKFDETLLQIWRNVVHGMTHHGGYGGVSHPYQVLLRLVARCPGITRAKCALALEAKDDSQGELDRIVNLSHLAEETIIEQIGVTPTNWDNAKKILPSFAEQLGDVAKQGQSLFLSDNPSDPTSTQQAASPVRETPPPRRETASRRRPRSSRAVNARTIAAAGAVDAFDENSAIDVEVPTEEAIANRIRSMSERLRRHNALVRRAAAQFETAGASLYENPFDCLASFPDGRDVLLEAKTLDGSVEDERSRVREALSQLLYYEAFVTRPSAQSSAPIKIALFETQISPEHCEWLERCNIYAVWPSGSGYASSASSSQITAEFFPSAV